MLPDFLRNPRVELAFVAIMCQMFHDNVAFQPKQNTLTVGLVRRGSVSQIGEERERADSHVSCGCTAWDYRLRSRNERDIADISVIFISLTETVHGHEQVFQGAAACPLPSSVEKYCLIEHLLCMYDFLGSIPRLLSLMCPSYCCIYLAL